MHLFLRCFLILLAGFPFASLIAQDTLRTDSIFVASFAPGTWLSGIDGNILFSSSSLPDDTLDLEQGIEFKIATQTGIFVKKHFNLGIRFELSSNRTGGQSGNVTSEALFIGPVVGKYFAGSGNWAVAPEISIGYLSSLADVKSNDPDFQSNLNIRNKGVSGQAGTTFLFLFSPHVSFTMNTRLNMGWIKSTKAAPNSGTISENIFLYGLGVSFGFRIFLDEFFF